MTKSCLQGAFLRLSSTDMFSQMDVSKNHCSHLSSCEYMWIIYHWGYPVEAVAFLSNPILLAKSPLSIWLGAVSAGKHVAMDKSSHIELSQKQDRTEQLCVCVFQIVSAQHLCSTKQRPCFELGERRSWRWDNRWDLRAARARLHQRDGQGLPVLLVCRSQRHAEQR